MPNYQDAIEEIKERAKFHKCEAELWGAPDFPEDSQPYADRRVVEHNAIGYELDNLADYLEKQY